MSLSNAIGEISKIKQTETNESKMVEHFLENKNKIKVLIEFNPRESES